MNGNEFYFGNCDGSIGTTLVRCREVMASLPWALITCLDSLSDLHEIRELPVLRSQYGASLHGNSILLPGSEIVRAALELKSFFVWFDEVWWFEHPPVLLMPDDISITAPVDFSEALNESAQRWFLDSNSILALGDGYGMNYMTSRKDLLLAIVEESTET